MGTPRNRSYLKTLWITLFTPAQSNYEDMHASFLNLTDDTIEDINATSIETSHVLAPDGAGGVEFRAEAADSDDKVKISATDTTAAYLDDKLDIGDEFTKEIENPAGNENLLLKFKGWIYNTLRTFKAILSFAGTADRTYTLLDESGTIPLLESDSTAFTGQAHGGYYVKTFSASATFDANDGNNQGMICTANSTIEIDNELRGTFIIQLVISGSSVTEFTIGTSLGDPYDNNAALIYSDGDINTIMVVIDAFGNKQYTINTITA